MIYPNYEDSLVLAEKYCIIPICKEIYADMITPIMLLRKLADTSKRCFLLESVEGGEKWARYSFLGFNPLMRVTCKDEVVKIEENGIISEKKTKKPL
ncbi:MAG: anthranilate synthase component I, partial [Bacillota bacterium]|nr:anthranilate synthase component I [Bacillota bacterium]